MGLEGIKQKIPKRSYKGEKWKSNSLNKKKLVIDFEKKCAYCDDPDYYSGGYNSYHVDHFAPKKLFRQLEFTYENLVYSCPYCNQAKSDKWVGKTSEENIVDNRGFEDPCSEKYNFHLKRDENGKIISKTEIGEYMYRELKLYLKRHQLIYNLEKIRALIKKLETKVSKMKEERKSTSELEKTIGELSREFVKYYNIFIEDIN